MPFFGKVQIHIFIKRRGHRTDQFATIVVHKSLKKKMQTPFNLFNLCFVSVNTGAKGHFDKGKEL